MVDSIQVQILLNHNDHGMIRGYRPGDELVKVYEGEHRLPYREEAITSLEYIFEQNQWLDRSQPWYQGRSLSMGDVVVLHETAYAVASIGFEKIDMPEAVIL